MKLYVLTITFFICQISFGQSPTTDSLQKQTASQPQTVAPIKDSSKKEKIILDSLLSTTYQESQYMQPCTPPTIYFYNNKKIIYYSPNCVNLLQFPDVRERFHPDTVSFRISNDSLYFVSSFTKEFLSKQETNIIASPFSYYWVWTFGTKQDKKLLNKIKKENDTLGLTIYREHLLFQNTSNQKILVFINDSLYYTIKDSTGDNNYIELIGNFIKNYPDTIKVKIKYNYFDGDKSVSTENIFLVSGYGAKMSLTVFIRYKYEISPFPYKHLIYCKGRLYPYTFNPSTPHYLGYGWTKKQ